MPNRPLIGHKKQVLQLRQDLENNNLSHAYLFTGPAHVGKTTLAHWFAREILKRDVPEEGYPELLRQMDHLLHPDFFVLDQLWMQDRMEDWDTIAQTSNIPQQHRAKQGTKTDIISIDDMRMIEDRIIETGNLPHRVCIIRGVERMQPPAASAFLKTLEEPPPGRVFLLTAESSSMVLPTILSRTRHLALERVAERDLQILLQDAEDANFIMHVAQGSPGTAIALMENPDRLRTEKLLHTQATSFWGAKKLHDKLKQLAPLEKRGDEADRFLFHLALALRQMPDYKPEHERALADLFVALKTNAHRVLQFQSFASAL